jgi:hypothetical protein
MRAVIATPLLYFKAELRGIRRRQRPRSPRAWSPGCCRSNAAARGASGRIPAFPSEPPMDAERINAIESKLNDLDARAGELRRYL